MASSATPVSESTDGPVLSVINKRLRALKKKYNRILQTEEAVAQGKPINKEQEDVLRSKTQVAAAIDELEKLRQPLANALQEELKIALQNQPLPSPSTATAPETNNNDNNNNSESDDGNPAARDGDVVEHLLNLLYFGSLFDVKSQGDFTATMLTRTHERGCCLTYDYVTDDATDLLAERDLDMISMLGGLLISRPVNSSLSHKNALQSCIEHAKLWLANSDSPIEPNSSVSYAQLRERLKKIMALDYFTTTPAMKGAVEVAAAAAAGNYVPFQVPVQGVPISVPVQMESSAVQYQPKDEETESFEGHEISGGQSTPPEEHSKDELEGENTAEVATDHEHVKASADMEHNQRDVESKDQQYGSRRGYQNQRGGRGGRRGYQNGRGGRSGGRGGGGYQNGRNQYHDQPGNFYPRNYYNNRGRGNRGGGHYNNHGSAQGGHATADVGVAS